MTEKIYYDTQDRPCTLYRMVREEPEWAASRIKAGEDAIIELEEIKARGKAWLDNEDKVRAKISRCDEYRDALEDIRDNTTPGSYAYAVAHSALDKTPLSFINSDKKTIEKCAAIAEEFPMSPVVGKAIAIQIRKMCKEGNE